MIVPLQLSQTMQISLTRKTNSHPHNKFTSVSACVEALCRDQLVVEKVGLEPKPSSDRIANADANTSPNARATPTQTL